MPDYTPIFLSAILYCFYLLMHEDQKRKELFNKAISIFEKREENSSDYEYIENDKISTKIVIDLLLEIKKYYHVREKYHELFSYCICNDHINKNNKLYGDFIAELNKPQILF